MHADWARFPSITELSLEYWLELVKSFTSGDDCACPYRYSRGALTAYGIIVMCVIALKTCAITVLGTCVGLHFSFLCVHLRFPLIASTTRALADAQYPVAHQSLFFILVSDSYVYTSQSTRSVLQSTGK